MDSNHRRKKKYVSPNPLFEKWLTEWKNEAAEKGFKSVHTYKKALSSLKKYPLPLSSGKEAKILEFFGDKICAMLDEKLLELQQSNGSSSVSSSQSSVDSGTYSAASKSSSDSTTVQKKKTTPKKRTISPAFQTQVVTKVIEKENKLCVKAPSVVVDLSDLSDDSEIEEESFCLFPGDFDILLCVDSCETVGGHGKAKKIFISELQKSSENYSIRKLHIGDFLWIAKEKNGYQRELVLDFVVERKRMDDLAHSIKDGRFREQKFRLHNCGLKRPIYLVENCGKGVYYGLPETTLEQAIANTEVRDRFLIKRTQNAKDSISYLLAMTRMLKNKFSNQILKSVSRRAYEKSSQSSNSFMTFGSFNCDSIKNKRLTVKEMFGKHLLQFSGLSVEKAIAIVDHFETPAKLLECFDNCENEEEKIDLVASIKDQSKKRIGQALGRTIYQYYCGQNAR